MLRGQLTICDENTLPQVCYSSRIIVLDEDKADVCTQFNGIMGSILLPPYSAMCKLMDNDVNGFITLYLNHLALPQVDEFIVVILRALFNGKNISIFIPNEKVSLKYPEVLMLYLLNNFGIRVGDITNPCMYDRNFDGLIMDKLYSYDLCTEEEFFQNIPTSYNTYSMPTLNKLIQKIRPYVNNPSLQAYMDYFNNYNISIKQRGKMLQPLIFKKE